VCFRPTKRAPPECGSGWACSTSSWVGTELAVGKMTRGMAAFGVGTELAVEKMTRGMAAVVAGGGRAPRVRSLAFSWRWRPTNHSRRLKVLPRYQLGRVWLAAVQTSCIVPSLISSGMVCLHPKHRYVECCALLPHCRLPHVISPRKSPLRTRALEFWTTRRLLPRFSQLSTFE
jgi:hypothetical protein